MIGRVARLELIAGVALVGSMALVSLLFAMRVCERSSGTPAAKVDGPTNVNVPKPPAIAPASIHYVGLSHSGCATSNCHGGSGEGPAWKTSAFVFHERDPHARAFRVLLDERSQEMVRRLNAGDIAATETLDATWYLEQIEQRCVGCHATPMPAEVAAVGSPSRAELAYEHYFHGVSCEACHGPASQWRDRHLTDAWSHDDRSHKAEAGFVDLEQSHIAAQQCAKCHLGGGVRGDQQVSHDLIAAGHPRLDFDFSAWYASLPPHWDTTRQQRPDFHTEQWLQGQTAAIQAQCDLVANQLKRISEEETSSQPWPELANFDCFACHQALRYPPSDRAAIGDSPLDQLPMGTRWHVIEQIEPVTVAAARAWLGEALSQRNAKPLELAPPRERSPQQLAEALADAPDAKSWEECVAWYYAADAVLRDAESIPSTDDPQGEVRAALDHLADALNTFLARNSDDQMRVSRYASPRGFPANDAVDARHALAAAREALGRLAEALASTNNAPDGRPISP
jgi:hypothetical protein